MTQLETFKAEQWDSVETVIGHHKVLSYEIETPREVVKCIVWGTNDGKIFQASASNSYSKPIAALLLDHFNTIDLSTLQAGNVTVFEKSFEPAGHFEALVIAPPEIGLFDHFSEDIRARVHLVIPAFKSEFKSGMSANEFRHQIGRKDGWRVYLYRWNRLEKTSPSWD